MYHLGLIGLGGGIGAMCRHLVNLGALRAFGPSFPFGTLAVNVIGGLLMGILAGYFAPRSGDQPSRPGFSLRPACSADSRPSRPFRSMPSCCGSGARWSPRSPTFSARSSSRLPPSQQDGRWSGPWHDRRRDPHGRQGRSRHAARPLVQAAFPRARLRPSAKAPALRPGAGGRRARRDVDAAGYGTGRARAAAHGGRRARERAGGGAAELGP